MAVAPSYSIGSHKSPVLHPTKPVLVGERLLTNGTFSIRKSFQRSPVLNAHKFGRKWDAAQQSIKKEMNHRDVLHSMVHHGSFLTFTQLGEPPLFMVYGTERDVKHASQYISRKTFRSFRCNASLSRNSGGQLKALDLYFSRLHEKVIGQQTSSMNRSDIEITYSEDYCKSSSDFDSKKVEDITKNDKFEANAELNSLENYFLKLEPGTQRSNSETFCKEYTETSRVKSSNSVADGHRQNDQMMEEDLGNLSLLKSANEGIAPETTDDQTYKGLQPHDEASDLCLINFLVSINVAVFLFEIATPVGSSNLQQLSLPLIYGAKINKLILDGEWWRLLTPMFLHSGFLHVAFSCWTLLSFGPQVCRRYGPLTFFLIYILGGICANITSFIRTSEIAVCGTGPVFAIIGAWLIYEVQNRETIEQEVSNNMFQKAVLVTAMGFLLSSTGQTDEWTHLGAAASGICYGFFTSPIMHLDNMSSEKGQKEGIALVRQQADPCKSLLTFFVFILTLCPLIYMFDQELDSFL